ncbi:hypothetical protein V8E36_005422 [Tilletia maclaganii]
MFTSSSLSLSDNLVLPTTTLHSYYRIMTSALVKLSALGAAVAATILAFAVSALPAMERCYGCPVTPVPAYTPYPVYGNVPNAVSCASGVQYTRYQIDQRINQTLEGYIPVSMQPFQLSEDGTTTSYDQLKLVCDAQPRDLYQIQFYGSDDEGSVLLVKQDGTFCGAFTRWHSSINGDYTRAPRSSSCVFCPSNEQVDPTDIVAPSGANCNNGRGPGTSEDYDYPYYPCGVQTAHDPNDPSTPDPYICYYGYDGAGGGTSLDPSDP